MHRGAVIVGHVLAPVALPSAAWAPQPSDTSLAVGVRVWVTIGYSTNSTEFSERGWRDIDNICANP
jgi:hypothetical protein